MPKEKQPVKIDSYIFDERFYQWEDDKGNRVYYPSVTYIIGSAYPQDYGLSWWRGDVGNRRADEIMEESGRLGSWVHEAIESMLKGHTIASKDIEEAFRSKDALKVYRCLQSFLDWYNEFKPEILRTEYTAWSDEHKFAGTVDLKCKIGDETYLVDFKTSKTIHNSHKVQISAYGLADPVDQVALLHLGNTTKKKYSFNVLKDRDRFVEEFKQTNNLFRTLNPEAQPSSETFPDLFKI